MDLLTHKTLAVYRLKPETPLAPPGVPKGLEAQRIHLADLDTFFARDRARQRLFGRFLRRGYLGVLVHQGAQWAGYAWMAPPGAPAPPHLPRWAGRLGVAWNCHAHVHPEFRGLGLQAAMLRLKAAWLRAIASGAAVPLCTATDAGHAGSRRSQIKAGLEPWGLMHLRVLKLPRIGAWAWGHWNAQQAHPPCPGPSHPRPPEADVSGFGLLSHDPLTLL